MELPLLEEIKPLYVLMRRIRCLPQQGVLRELCKSLVKSFICLVWAMTVKITPPPPVPVNTPSVYGICKRFGLPCRDHPVPS